MKPKQLPKEVQEKIEAIKAEMLPLVNIPGSISYKKNELLEAMAVLEFAKSLNRPVVHVGPGDCKELREYRQRQKEGYMDVKAVAIKLGVSAREVYQLKKTGKLNATIKNNRFFFDKTEVEKLGSEYGSLIN